MLNNNYELTSEEEETFSTDFEKVMSDVKLSKLNRQQIEANLGSIANLRIGVYFWTVTFNNKVHKVYIGKTKCLSRRMIDYIQPFQIHSPNDIKMQDFQTYVLNRYPDAVFNLYFMPTDIDTYTKKETDAIQQYEPAMNKRAEYTKEMREEMRKLFQRMNFDNFDIKFPG